MSIQKLDLVPKNIKDLKTLTEVDLVDVTRSSSEFDVTKSFIVHALESEAALYKTTLRNDSFLRMEEAYSEGRASVHALFLKFREASHKVCAGVVTEYHSIYPCWNPDRKEFEFYGATHQDDIFMSKELGLHLGRSILPHGMTLGAFAISTQMFRSIANNGCFGPSAAMRFEYSPRQQFGYALAKKVGGIKAQEFEDQVMMITNPELLKGPTSRLVDSIYPRNLIISDPIVNNGKTIMPNGFTVATDERVHGYNIAVACSRGKSTFTGDDIIELVLRSDGDIETVQKFYSRHRHNNEYPELTELLKACLRSAADKIFDQKWLSDNEGVERPEDVFKYTHIYLGEEKELGIALKNLNPAQRHLGPFPMYGGEIVYSETQEPLLPKDRPTPSPLIEVRLPSGGTSQTPTLDAVNARGSNRTSTMLRSVRESTRMFFSGSCTQQISCPC